MVDFEGTMLLPADATAQLLVSLAVPTEGTELSAGAALNDATADDAVLHEPLQERGDEWIGRTARVSKEERGQNPADSGPEAAAMTR